MTDGEYSPHYLAFPGSRPSGGKPEVRVEKPGFTRLVPPWKPHSFRLAEYPPEIGRGWRAVPPAYSYRNATIGSTFVARRAGT